VKSSSIKSTTKFFTLVLGVLWGPLLALGASSNSSSSPGGGSTQTLTSQKARIVNAAVAVVAEDVLTIRRVNLSSILEHWLLLHSEATTHLENNSERSADHKDWIPVWGTPAFRAETSLLVVDELVSREAQFQQTAQIPTENVQKLTNQIIEDLKNWPPWKDLEASPEELRAMMGRHLLATEFLKTKSEASGLQVSELDARNYFEANKAQFNGLDYKLFNEAIKKFLIRRQTESSLKSWIDGLRGKYHARLLLD